jgi:hypothetical protein
MTAPQGVKLLNPGAWISASHLVLRFHVDVSDEPLKPQVEVEPTITPFSGQPTNSGATLSQSGMVTITVGNLVNGTAYHWQARVEGQNDGPSAWVPFAAAGSQTPDFAVDQTPPTRPVISSPSNPNPTQWYHNRTIMLRWTSKDTLSGVQGYSYVLERQPHVIPPGTLTTQSSVRLSTLSDGVWFVAVRSEDQAGNWSPTATYRLQLDRQPPQLTWLSPSRMTLNPYRGPVSVSFRVNKTSNVHLNLYRVGSNKPVASYSFQRVAPGHVVTIGLNGKDRKGNLLPKGYYFFNVQAVDHADNVGRWNAGGIQLDPLKPARSATGQVLYPDGGKQIIVSLSRQTLYAYDGTHLVLQTYVTTGNPSLPTPLGTFHILAKYHPFEFISPWPQGSPYWYAPSWTNYAMLFQSQGYFLHDAPWRSAYGPGTNGPGQPGTNYGGTHGCVNIPFGPTLALWNWAPIGTTVLIVP